MKLALVHDYLREFGGAERVVEVMHEIWPTAPLYTSFVDWDALGAHAARFNGWDIRTSWVQHNPLVKRLHSPLRFLAPQVWESFDMSGYDVVLSSSGWYICRGVITEPPQLHICYIHHPPRNLYGYATGSSLQKYGIVRAYAHLINFYLRKYDFRTAQKVDYFVANSQETARRVEKFYRRDSTVIYPPVHLPKRVQNKIKGEYYLSVGRLTYSKQIHLAIIACNERKQPLKIVGTGKEEAALRAIAGPTIEFCGAVTDAQLSELYAGAKALLFCALDEDFGMVPVESMAYGVPVIALAQGGVKETVIDGKTGVWFTSPTAAALAAAMFTFERTKTDWSAACTRQAEQFGTAEFKHAIRTFVEEKYASRRKML